MCFVKPSNHNLHCLKFGFNYHFNSFLSIDFQMTFSLSSSIALPWRECAVTNGTVVLSRGYNDLPLRQNSSSLNLHCNECKEWLASLPLGSQKWALFKNSAISKKERLAAVQSHEPFTNNVIDLWGRILVFGCQTQISCYSIILNLNKNKHWRLMSRITVDRAWNVYWLLLLNNKSFLVKLALQVFAHETLLQSMWHYMYLLESVRFYVPQWPPELFDGQRFVTCLVLQSDLLKNIYKMASLGRIDVQSIDKRLFWLVAELEWLNEKRN